MKILESQSAVLTNHEVLTALTTLRAKPRTTPKKSQNFETVVKELTDYLNPPPSSHPPSPLPKYAPPHYTLDTIRALLEALQPYDLTKAELLTICNLRPTDLGLLDCVVEECDLRFKEEEQEEICRLVEEVIKSGDEEVETVEQGEDEGGVRLDGETVLGDDGEERGSSQETVK